MSAVSKKKKRKVNVGDKNQDDSVNLKGTDDENLTDTIKMKKNHKKKKK